MSQDQRSGTLVISVSNRQKPLTVRYGRKIAEWVAFRLELALAHNRGEVPAFVAQLQSGLAELDRQKPPPPSQMIGKRAPHGTSQAQWARESGQRSDHRPLRIGAIIVGAVLVLLVVIGVTAPKSQPSHHRVQATSSTHHKWQTSSYADGVAWAKTDHSALYSPPGCERRYMVGTGYVSDPNDPSLKVPGTNDPHDTYAEWRRGCRVRRHSN